MGELLQLRKKETESEKPDFPENDSVVELDREVKEEELIFLLDSLTKLLRTVPGNVKSSMLFKKHLNTVSRYTNEEIIGWINNGTIQQITKDPAFFVAVIEKAKERGIIKKEERKLV